MMPTQKVIIGSATGLHARPAALFVQAVNDAGLAVKIARPGGTPAPANSMLAIMALGAKQGEEVELSCDDPGAEGVLDTLVTLLAKDLDAEE